MTDIEMEGGNATIRPQPMTAEQTNPITHNIGVMAMENIVRLWCPCGWMRVFTPPTNEPGTISVVQLGALNFYAQYHLAHPEEE